jgi:hypothetical protein
MLLSNRFHELSISLENQFDAFSFGRSFSRHSDLTTKLTTRALCESRWCRERRIGRNAQDDSKRTFEDVLLNSELVAKIELSIFQSHADINRKLQKNFILEGFPASS